MRCPRCNGKTDKVETGSKKLDYILACYDCVWQVAARSLQVWFDKWR